MSYSFTSIGILHSCFDEKCGTPKQSRVSPHSTAVLELAPQLDAAAMLEGLETFSHLWVLWVFHANQNLNEIKKVRPPRMGGEKAGVFASRSPHRPNPIGLSVVKLDRIDGRLLYLSGVDFVSGTPVLDIKPYIPKWDRVAEATDGWLMDHPDTVLPVEFSVESLQQLEKLQTDGQLPLPLPQMQNLIEECLANDPRPVPYRKLEEVRPEAIKQQYGFLIHNLNVVFKWQGPLGFLVTGIEKRVPRTHRDR
ncbi:MAG: tRNA (N6-threonylcarbamoyladenosine(37)-N6)-methyltransferase TrmO [Bdellovibrionales bacterium]|nr:tRNA (N6-threonylcarbamoyladenosine(37)-N6)-methyltransferase TrmO [Bdellovibrionales bacterium]